RDTEERIEKLDLKNIVKGQEILDIGTNAGFLLLNLASEMRRGTGIEINPYLIDTADAVRRHLDVDNAEFKCTAFEDFSGEEGRFDVVLSLANHSTYDGNTRQSIEEYFRKCAALMNDKGIFLFESHAPEIEPPEKL